MNAISSRSLDGPIPALTNDEERFRFALAGAGHGVVDWDIVRGKACVCPVFVRSLGYEPEEVRGTYGEWVDHLHPDEREHVLAQLQQHLRGESELLVMEHRMRCKDGSWRWVLDRARVVSWDANGKPLRLLGTHTDITETRQTEERLRALLAEKELLLSEVHHRIKNNMASICGLLALHADAVSDPFAGAAFSDLERRIQSMNVLYERLHQSGDFQSVSLADYLTDVISAVAESFSYTSMVTVDTDFSSMNGSVDVRVAFPLGLIATELLTNSFKHAFPDSETGAVTVRLAHHGDGTVRLTHRDDGVGMVESRAPENGGGFGMTLVRELADQLGATVNVISAEGTVIEVAIPYHLVAATKAADQSQ